MIFPEHTITSLLGLAVGDAFGCPFEYHEGAPDLSRLSLDQQRYLSGYEDCKLPPRRCRTPGLGSDDTQQSLVLLWIWNQLAVKGKDPKDATMVGGLFIRVCRKMADATVPRRSPSFGVHRGTGRNFREAILNLVPPDTAGMGAAMRVGPASTLLEPSEVLPWVVKVSETTTSNPIAQAAAAMFALKANTLARQESDPSEDDIGLDRMTPEFIDAWRVLERACEVMTARGEEGLLEYAAKTGESNKDLKGAANGFALTGIPWVLGCVDSATSFSDALLQVCASGGDTDTVCAMAGCLAALKFGRDGVPVWMTEQLVGIDHILDPTIWNPVGTEREYAVLDTKVLVAAEERVHQAMLARKQPKP